MSYTPGTDLGRLREILGDTDPDEIFTDAYLEDLLDEKGSVNRAGIAALRRLMLDTPLLQKKFRGLGQVNFNTLGNFIRIIEELINHLQDSDDGLVDASSSESAVPEADQDILGQSTDEDGWYERTTVDSYLDELTTRR